MGQTYKIVAVEDGSARDWRGQGGGLFTSYRCLLDGVLGAVEVNKKQGGNPPIVGDELFGRLEPKQAYGFQWKFLTEQRSDGGPGGGGRGDYSPEAQKRIDATGRVKGRCHAQAVAAAMLEGSGDLADIDFHDADRANAFLRGTFRPLVDWLVADAESARQEKPDSPRVTRPARVEPPVNEQPPLPSAAEWGYE